MTHQNIKVTLFLAALVCIAGFGIQHTIAAPVLESGSLIKASGASVYYLGVDGKRYVFPNEKIYLSWYKDFSGVKTISDSSLASYIIGGNVTYKPGVRLVKIASVPKVYAVSAGGVLRWLPDEATAAAIYGAGWASMVDDVPVSFFVNYKIGNDVGPTQRYNRTQELGNATDISTDAGLLANASGSQNTNQTSNNNTNAPGAVSGNGGGSSTPTPADTTAPTITAFEIPSTSSSLTVPVTILTVSDNVAVTGFLLTETGATPSASASGWSATPPTSYVFSSQGTKTLYVWVKDATGNISATTSDTVTISIVDDAPPVVVNPVKTLGPNPPTSLVIAGRTFDPNEPLTPQPSGSGGTTYYVDGASGDDSAAGTALSSAFKTIQQGLDALSNGGDRVLIRSGLYRERVAIYDKDAPDGNPFVISAYGDGEVIIDGSQAVTGWTVYSGNIYMASPGFTASSVVIDNQPYYKEASLAALSAAPTLAGVPTERRFFYSEQSDKLYVRTDGGSPANRDVGVLVDDKSQDVVYLWNSNNFVIYGLTVRFGGGRGINTYGSNNTRIENNRVVFNNWTGISTLKIDDSHSGANHRVIKNYVYYNFMSNWPRGRWSWGGWGAGIGIQGTPSALIEGNISQKNGGEGILTYLGDGGTIFRNNVSVDNWSVNIYYDNTKDGVIEGNVAMCHAPNPADMYNNGDENDEEYWSGFRRMRPIAIMTADENYGGQPPATLNNITIQNNIMINCQRGIEHYGQAPGSGLKNIKVLNNTIIMPTPTDPHESNVVGISIPYNGGNNSGSIYRNNIIVSGGYYDGDDGYLMRSVDGGGVTNSFLGLTIDHNVFYQPNESARSFRWGGNWGDNLTHDEWLALSGAAHGGGDIVADPRLIDATTDSILDKRLSQVSPARDAGVNTGASADFLNVLRPQGLGYDMGAFEE